MKKQTIPTKVYDFLVKTGLALTKDQICRQLDIKEGSVDYACSKLRKEKKVI